MTMQSVDGTLAVAILALVVLPFGAAGLVQATIEMVRQQRRESAAIAAAERARDEIEHSRQMR